MILENAKYLECQDMSYEVRQELGAGPLVLRGFIVPDLDGFGVRLGSYLEDQGRKEQIYNVMVGS